MAQTVTFYEDIQPIIFKNCTSCHRPSQIAPMPFLSFDDITAYGSMIKYVVNTNYMPPWMPEPNQVHLRNERRLSKKEINLINAWVDSGMEPGNAAKSLSTPDYDDQPKMKKPDAVFSMQDSFEQYGVYYDQYKVFVIPTDLEEDKKISAIEFVPGNSTIVRSCFVSIDRTDRSDPLDEWDPTSGYFSFGEVGFTPMESRWFTWNPLQGVKDYEDGAVKVLPKGAKLLFHIHYGPTSKPLKDRSELRIRFSKEPDSKIIQNIPLIHKYNLTNLPFEIESKEVKRFHSKFIVPYDLSLHSIMPHSNLLGNTWEVFTVDPKSKKSKVLLRIEDWDFKWKEQYAFSEPMLLKKGTVVHALAQYDNSEKNLSNPSDPPRKMTWGKRMFEELFLVYFEVSPIEESSKIQALFNPSMVTNGKFSFDFENKTPQKLTMEIIDFKGVKKGSIFQNKQFHVGPQKIDVNSKDLPFGNYYIEISNENQEVLTRHCFLNVEQDFFE